MKKALMKSGCLGIALGLLFLAGACEDHLERSLRDDLVGVWLLYERGLSPGSGYIVNQIPPTPPQFIIFYKNGRVAVSGSEFRHWQKFRRYYLHPSAADQYHRISFKSRGTDEVTEMYFTVNRDTLTLSPYCVEGCHSAFVRID